MDSPPYFDPLYPLLPSLTDSDSTPDSFESTPELSWPFDAPPDPNELHDFIFAADDEGVAFAFDGDGDQPAVPAPNVTAAVDDVRSSTEADAAGAYAPVVRSSKGKRVVCLSACVQCRRAKTRCDGQRPCARCASHGRADDCVDRPAEEVERGKQNRKRRPKVQSSLAALSSAGQPAAADTLPPSPPQAQSVYHPLDSSAAKLSFGQSAILQQSIIARIDKICATRSPDDVVRLRFIRAVHLLLAKIADALSPRHFDLIINSQLPGADAHSGPVAPLPACLRVWSRLETRPLFLDWSVSPTVCEADHGVDAIPVIRIRTGPAAQRALEQWESRQQQLDDQQQQPQPALHDRAAQPIEEIFSCLGVADRLDRSDASITHSKPAPSSPLHAHWCPVFSGVPPSSAPSAAVDPTAPLPCACFSATALPTEMIVNAAWERLFGYSQAELRLQLMHRGCTVMMDWYAADSWWALHALLASHALTDRRYGYRVRAFVVVRTRWGAELPCMLEKRIVEEGNGFTQAVSTIAPLAQLSAHVQPHPAQPLHAAEDAE